MANAEVAEKKPEDVKVEEEEEDEDMPDLEDAPATTEGGGEGQSSGADGDDPSAGDDSKQSKAEKKARKSLAKMGLKKVQGVDRVTLKKSKTILFVLTAPDVYKSPNSDIYVVFGEAKVEDMSAMANAAANAGKFQPQVPSKASGAAASSAAAAGKKSAIDKAPAALAAPAEDEEAVDESGLEQKDIELVMQQANVSRSRAVKALRSSNNDIVNAIMELTM